MKNFKNQVLIVLVILIAGIKIYFLQNTYSGLTSREITLLEANRIGLEKAKEFDVNASLIFITSVDDGIDSGENGRRGNWNLMYALPNINKRLFLSIKDREITKYRTIDKITRSGIASNKIKVDSKYVVNKAIKTYNLQPGKIDGFFNGIHFKLLKENETVLIGVIGINDANEIFDIYFNAETGEYVRESTNGKEVIKNEN